MHKSHPITAIHRLPYHRLLQSLFEMYFVFAAIWAFGGALVEKDGINYRKNFDKWWKSTWTAVKLPG
jgi:dynein heavy chain